MWNTVEQALTAKGFRRHEQRAEPGFPSRKVLFQRRLENVEPVCQCNDKLHLNITLFSFELHGKTHESAELDITGEMPDGEWAKLSIYSVTLPSLLERLENFEHRLIAAWKASCSDIPVEATQSND